MWIERINFVAALLSAPSIPGPIGSERGFYRPHLPVTCTKLNMVRHYLQTFLVYIRNLSGVFVNVPEVLFFSLLLIILKVRRHRFCSDFPM